MCSAYSLIFSASVAATRYVLCAALNACPASSLSVTTAAPSAIPPPRTSSLRLLLFPNDGRVAWPSSRPAVLANVLRCCRQPRHVQGGIVAVRRATLKEPCREPPRREVERMEADIMRSLYHRKKKKRNADAGLRDTKRATWTWIDVGVMSSFFFLGIETLSQIGDLRPNADHVWRMRPAYVQSIYTIADT